MKKIISLKLKELVSYFEGLSDDQRKKITAYIYISLTLFTVSFFGFFAIAPTLATISNLKKQYEDNKLVLDALNKKLTSLTLLDVQYKEIQPDLEKIYSAIPRTSRIPYLTRQLEIIAKDSGVIIKKLDFGTVELHPNIKADPIYSFTFTIDVTGEEQNVNSFISQIIGFDRIVGVDKISTGKNEENRYEASIIGRVYFSDK
jgi:Tfp pilus assembly protein PilO